MAESRRDQTQMDPRWQRIKDVVATSASRPPDERARFLAPTCADDKSIRHEAGRCWRHITEPAGPSNP